MGGEGRGGRGGREGGRGVVKVEGGRRESERQEEWRVESGEWRVESGVWRVESGEWRVEGGEWLAAVGRRGTTATVVAGRDSQDSGRRGPPRPPWTAVGFTAPPRPASSPDRGLREPLPCSTCHDSGRRRDTEVSGSQVVVRCRWRST
jgi:hypothetical protein